MSEASPGRMLRAARERQGLHIAALAAAIKVAPRKLDALENDRWEDLPDATFARALAQTVCRTLKIDPRPVLELLPASATSLERANNGLNAPFRRGRDQPGATASAIRPMVWAGLVLMVAAVVVYLLPEGVFQSRRPATVPVDVAASDAAPAVSGAASAGAIDPVVGAPDAISSAVTAGSAAVAGTRAAEAAVPAATVPAASTPGTPSAAADASPAIVQLRTTQPSWIEVRDARGSLLLSRLVQPGESVGFDGGLPLRMTIGNAAATQVTLRGEPVDLGSRARDNVARFELQ